MNQIIESVDWDGTFDEFLNFLRTDPQFYFETPEELLQAYLAISKKIDPKIVPLLCKLVLKKWSCGVCKYLSGLRALHVDFIFGAKRRSYFAPFQN